jgi:hypothetical protein
MASTWNRSDVLWWAGVAVAVPVLGAAGWWAVEKSYNTVTPYQVLIFRWDKAPRPLFQRPSQGTHL